MLRSKISLYMTLGAAFGQAWLLAIVLTLGTAVTVPSATAQVLFDWARECSEDELLKALDRA